MSLSPARSEAIETAIGALWKDAELCMNDYLTVAPVFALMDTLNIRFIEEAGLTLQKVADWLKKANRTLEMPGGDKQLAGFLYAEPLDAFLFVKADDPLARRRFSAAHELGHLILHWNPSQTVFRDGLSFRFSPEEEAQRNAGESENLTTHEGGSQEICASPDLDLMEQEANVFAARLLMPETVCRRLWQQHSVRFGARPVLLARRLATDLMVSPLAMKIRLAELGLMP